MRRETIYVTELIDGLDAYCPDCRWPIHAYADPEGVWIECTCDAGYVFGRRVVVLVIE